VRPKAPPFPFKGGEHICRVAWYGEEGEPNILTEKTNPKVTKRNRQNIGAKKKTRLLLAKDDSSEIQGLPSFLYLEGG